MNQKRKNGHLKQNTLLYIHKFSTNNMAVKYGNTTSMEILQANYFNLYVKYSRYELLLQG